MDCFEVIIAGSGPAGVTAASALAGHDVAIVDVGQAPLPASAQSSHPFGPRFEGLSHLAGELSRHPKLRSAAFAHVPSGEPYSVQSADGKPLLRSCFSHARGGFSEAWGAQLLRYTPADLNGLHGWDSGLGDGLDDHYDALEAHIGIAGERGELDDFFGPSPCLLPALPDTPLTQRLLARYDRLTAREDIPGVRIGRPRLAVLPRDYRGRPAYRFANDEFHCASDPGLYRPSLDLQRLREQGAVTYLPQMCLVRYQEADDHVLLTLRDGAGDLRQLRARHLLIACGAAQSAALVLRSEATVPRTLPFIDHPPTLLPAFFPLAPASRGPAYPIQLVASLGEGASFASLYSLHGVRALDRLFDLPLPIDSNLRVLPWLFQRMLVAQVWDQTDAPTASRLTLDGAGEIAITAEVPSVSPRTALLASVLRALGGITATRLASCPPPTWGFHHAGTLPMARRPFPGQTHPDGRLWHRQRVRVIDGSVLPSLPSKNPSLTIMAIARRIATQLAKRLSSETAAVEVAA